MESQNSGQLSVWNHDPCIKLGWCRLPSKVVHHTQQTLFHVQRARLMSMFMDLRWDEKVPIHVTIMQATVHFWCIGDNSERSNLWDHVDPGWIWHVCVWSTQPTPTWSPFTAEAMQGELTAFYPPFPLALLRLARVEISVDLKQQGTRRSLKGIFKEQRCWGLPQQLLATIGCIESFRGQRLTQGACTLE